MDLFDPSVRHAAPTVAIGKHEWVVQVHEHDRRLYTRYRWRRHGADAGAGRGERDWPHDDRNDRLCGGLPKTLERHDTRRQAAIKTALGRSARATLFRAVANGRGGSPRARSRRGGFGPGHRRAWSGRCGTHDWVIGCNSKFDRAIGAWQQERRV